MRILPVLVSADYDETLKQQMYDHKQNQALPSKLYILNPRFYPVEFRMEPGGNGDIFITRQHFNTKDNWHKRKVLYVPGFCIIDLKPGESEEQFEIKYKANNDDNSEYQVMSYFSVSDKRLVTHSDHPHCGVFFDLPSFQFEIKYGRLASEYLADTATAVLGSVNVGYTEIACFKKNIENPVVKCYLKVLPSSMTEQVFGRMIDDILAVHRQLLVSKRGKQSISLNRSWNTNLLEINERLNRLESCFNLILKRYYTRLKLMRCNINRRSVKKFNDRFIMQYAADPSKQKYKAETLVEDNNIYEHRMLLWALNGLSKFVNTVSRSVEEKDKIEKVKIRHDKELFLKQYNLNRIEDADKLIQALDVCNRGDIYDKFIECHYDVMEDDGNQNLIRGCVSFDDFCIYDEDWSAGYYPVTLTCCGFEGTKFFLSYTCEYKEDGEKKDLTLKFLSNDVKWQELVYKEFNKIRSKYNCSVQSGYSSGYLVKINGKHILARNDDNKRAYVFYSIDSFSINGKEYLPLNSLKAARTHLKQLYNDMYEVDDNIRVRYEVFEEQGFKYLVRELEAEKNKFSKNNQEIDSEAIVHKELDNKILKLKQYSFLDKLAEKGNETWTLTQKFINDSNYKAAYNFFHELNECYHFSELNSSYSLIHQKVNDLYEYWIFIKILEVLLLKQKWDLIEVNGSITKDVQKDISEIVSKILSTQNDALQNCTLVFSHALRNDRKAAILTFSYNRDINFIKRIGKSDHLTPDYHFVITYENSEKKMIKKHFCLDAKYRNYKNQKGKWTEDINKVCIDKYLIKLNESLKQNSNNEDVDEEYIAAFIVHSDADSYPYWGGNPRKALKIDQINCGKRYPKHRIGSFPLLPNSVLKNGNMKDIERNLLTFFIMIFEYHCELYDVCWECGNVEPTRLESSAGSFHYLCESCNRFWVKYHCQHKDHHPLIKHKYNYHKESTPNSHFLVICPECGDEYEI